MLKRRNQAVVLVQRDYELPLGESCKALEEAHDLTTIEPANDGEYALKILMGKSCKEVRLVHNNSLPTSFLAMSIGDDNWVKGFLLWYHMRSMKLLSLLLMIT